MSGTNPKRRLFVTTALPYANGSFHIGHIMEYIQADIWVRFQRMQGHEVHFVCADDAHGAPIMLKAEAEGITPKELVNRIAAERPKYLEGFHVAFDHWHSTDSPENTELAQDIYKRLDAVKLIKRENVEQFYDPVKKMFLADRYIKGECPNCGTKDQYGDNCESCGAVYAPTDLKNPYSTLTGAPPVMKSSDHYFFRLSDERCKVFLKEWLETPGRLQSQVVNKAKELLEGEGEKALADWDISRDAPYFGIEIPGAPGKFFYVWLDAPIGYLASLRNYFEAGKAKVNPHLPSRTDQSFQEFLADEKVEQIHFIGKDIIYFHTLFWPAMLKFAGQPYKVPDHVYVHGFINVSGEKMSKSRGTGLDPLRYLNEAKMNPEWLRYYIAAKLNANVEDVDFNPDDFVARVNSDLVGKYVNIASRIAPFLAKFFNNQVPAIKMSTFSGVPVTADTAGFAYALAHSQAIQTHFEEREFGKAVRAIMEVADVINKEIDGFKPWLLAKEAASNADVKDQLGQICASSLAGFKLLTLFLKPILPSLAVDAERYLNSGAVNWDDAKAVCKWLTEKETAEGRLPKGMSYRLPMDEEWSRAVGLAAEEGATPKERHKKNETDYPWGTEFPPPPTVGNYADSAYHEKFPASAWIQGYTDGFALTAPVGSFPPNQFGIHDLGGNLWDWCEDLFEAGGIKRTGRGASWVNTPGTKGSLFSSYRMDEVSEKRQRDIGFRVVLDLGGK